LSEILRDYGKVRINQDQFLQEEEKYLEQVLRSHRQMKLAIRTWADFLADMNDCGNYSFPKKTICAHICDRLMVSGGWTEGEVSLVRRTLPPEYKDPAKDRYLALNYLRSNDRNPFSIYGDFDQDAKSPKTKEEMRAMSKAEYTEYAKRRIALNKEIQKRRREENNDILEVAKEKGISLEPEKESRDKVPEWMHEITEAYTHTYQLATYFTNIGARLFRICDLMKEFAPKGDVIKYVVEQIKRYYPKVDPIATAVELYCRGFDDILINYDDDKYGACPSDWMKIGYDQIVTAGSHGSGVINSIRTGEWVFRASKDPNYDFVILPLEREFTREQVGDKTSKDLLVKCRNMLQMNQVERALMEWSKKTIITRQVHTPEEFWKTLQR
jgi:hypothetical protein